MRDEFSPDVYSNAGNSRRSITVSRADRSVAFLRSKGDLSRHRLTKLFTGSGSLRHIVWAPRYSGNGFAYCCSTAGHVWHSPCRMINVQSLTPRGCFHIRPPKYGKRLRADLESEFHSWAQQKRFCDITRWEPVVFCGRATSTGAMLKLEASRALNAENGLFSEVGNILCPAAKTF